MDATINALGQLLIQALPTFFIVLLLHYYLKQMFFKPLGRLLAEREEATQGARRKAAEALETANAHAATYEERMRAVRNEIYRDQEEQRRRWREEQSSQMAEARRSADAAIVGARAELASEAHRAKQNLAAESDGLADRILYAILGGKAS